MNSIDSLWILFKSQPRAVRKMFTERVLMDDIQAEQTRRRLVVKQSLEEALKELKEAEDSGMELPDAKSLFNSLQPSFG